jgi:hypothetical protein
MPHSDSTLAEAKLENEQALAKLRAMQTAALEGRLLDREHERGAMGAGFRRALSAWATESPAAARAAGQKSCGLRPASAAML